MSENTAPSGADHATRKARVLLSCIAAPTQKPVRALVETLGPKELMRRVADGETSSKTEATLRERYLALGANHLDKLREHAGRHQIGVIVPEDPFWPAQLDDLPDAPWMLYFRGAGGDRDQVHRHLAATQRAVAVIGSRAISAQGQEAVNAIVPGLSAAGVTILSGNAKGVDIAGHRAALRAGAHLETPTIAVLANGLDTIYPRLHAADLDVIAKTGLVLSENPPGAEPSGARLMARNRIIVALSQGTVAVEAGERSGSLNAVRRAAGLNRVVMRAGQPLRAGLSAGTQNLDVPVVENSEQVIAHIREGLRRE